MQCYHKCFFLLLPLIFSTFLFHLSEIISCISLWKVATIHNMLPTYFLTSSSSIMLFPLYLSLPLLFSLSHTHSPGLLHSHSSPSNLYLGAMLVAPTHSHQAFQCIPTGCRAYHTLSFLAHILMHAQTHTRFWRHAGLCRLTLWWRIPCLDEVCMNVWWWVCVCVTLALNNKTNGRQSRTWQWEEMQAL